MVQGDAGGEPCLIDWVKEYLKTAYQKPGNVFLGLLHRLDRPVSGVVLFAKTSKGASRLSEQFRAHAIQKTYQAVVCGAPKNKQGILINYLLKNEVKNKTEVFDIETTGAQYAELSYVVLKSSTDFSLLEIVLKTGRSHQIRAQLARMGTPIAGDVKYGAPKPLPDRSLALCAVRLLFRLATQEREQEVALPTPPEWAVFFKD